MGVVGQDQSSVMDLVAACERMLATVDDQVAHCVLAALFVREPLTIQPPAETIGPIVESLQAMRGALDAVNGTLIESKARAFALDPSRPMELVLRVPVSGGYVSSAAILTTPPWFRESDSAPGACEGLPFFFAKALVRMVAAVRKKMLAVNVESN